MSSELQSLIIQLSHKQKVIFAALTCEKMYPLYQVFSSLAQWGDAEIYLEGIATLYNFVLSGPESSYSSVIGDVEAIMPDLDDFTGTAPAHALDACSALVEAIMFLTDYDSEHIINCSTAATDTVDMHIQLVMDIDPNHYNLDNIINSGVLMINELQRQRRLATALKPINQFTTELIAQIRRLNGMEEIIDVQSLI